MSTLWMTSVPEQHKLERYHSDVFTDEKWEELYREARTRIKSCDTAFDHLKRHQLVLQNLRDLNKSGDCEFLPIPLGIERKSDDPRFVTWSPAATVFGDIIQTPEQLGAPNFQLLPNHACKRLILKGDEVDSAEVAVLSSNDTESVNIKAKLAYVICAGAALTPQILSNSGLDDALPALVCILDHNMEPIDLTAVFCSGSLPYGAVRCILSGRAEGGIGAQMETAAESDRRIL